MDIGWSFAIVLVLTSFLTAMAVIMMVSYLPMLPRRLIGPSVSQRHDDTAFLFDDDRLLDATPRARNLLMQGPEGMGDWSKLTSLLAPRFPGLGQKMASLSEQGYIEIEEHGGSGLLCAQWLGGTARITLQDGLGDADHAAIDPSSFSAMQAELDTLREIVSQMPTLAWQQDASGAITWANKAYLQLAEIVQGQEDVLVWPLPRLFDAHIDDISPRRQSVNIAGEDIQWFDCMGVTQKGSTLYFAAPADAAVNAETSLQNFVQTLTKTFAGLPTGLAIFNRSRNLVMFNPALVDLCMLEPQFLTSRPSLFMFLDQLREKQMIPEPKDYKSWRQKMTSLEQDAVNGVYEETWSLPSGQTFRVTGRPHPDGAVAFLIEDISSEVSLTRHFRAELETGQAVIDSFDDALAVFSPAGVLTMSNAAYAQLWGSDPALSLCEISLRDAVQLWSSQCDSADCLNHLQDGIPNKAATDPELGKVTLNDGRVFCVQFKPIAAGASMITFSQTQPGAIRSNQPSKSAATALPA
ncbi:PAS/PAC sensor domain-containing protein [Actibacterium atlanticum]|uniref:PAS/PAC sensor domain-containing protein n=1 Tax=Actibacterium atlanticum TaxID=1461693 RepID=A0A058ZNZ8_9RHOB|nr:PAS-domain containing protein [Actibacterium atlanticum]KCV82556.1 PAS/PAC sensor domain-containing protein [Actibacterium atlanticum]